VNGWSTHAIKGNYSRLIAIKGVAKGNNRHFSASFVSPVRAKQSPGCLSGQEAPWPSSGKAAKPPLKGWSFTPGHFCLITGDIFLLTIVCRLMIPYPDLKHNALIGGYSCSYYFAREKLPENQ